MSNQESLNDKNNIFKFPSKKIPLDYCPNSPDTKHVFVQQEYEAEVKSCFWCGLLVIPEAVHRYPETACNHS
jgi:hypothetical protein